ncbi:hypothetical protein [Sharpea azabuensis]|uniref:Uncharacterized protein n=1 Tax=Sharpea azabuensis TaxID=322505 RepID=A0A1H6VPF2_9FIRM|nr:hypothetical protein [Sharpea azabuensis]SEJ02530.1 hypothetical protein SAMN04487834_10463 [Sharpea azabuensis]
MNENLEKFTREFMEARAHRHKEMKKHEYAYKKLRAQVEEQENDELETILTSYEKKIQRIICHLSERGMTNKEISQITEMPVEEVVHILAKYMTE